MFPFIGWNESFPDILDKIFVALHFWRYVFSNYLLQLLFSVIIAMRVIARLVFAIFRDKQSFPSEATLWLLCEPVTGIQMIRLVK